jgi:hypothetical protein
MGIQPNPLEPDLAKTIEKGPPLADDLKAFARVENLIGQEQALLSIPKNERTEAQHRLLHEIREELDRIAAALRARPLTT